MTREQANTVKKDHPNAIDLTKSSHFGELSPLVEVHVEIVRIARGECVKMYDKDGSGFMPNEAAIQRLGMAAGVQFSPNAESTRKDGPACWVGTAQTMQMAPDGKYEFGPPSEYEWDADIQTEALRVAGKKGPWNDAEKRYEKKAYTEQELAENRMQFMKTGRQRANTGARTRAVLAALGMKRSVKTLFTEKGEDGDVREFLVSRIIQNTKNEMVLKASLTNMQGFTAALFGANKGQVSIAAPEAVHGSFEVVDDFDPSAGGSHDEPVNNPFRTAMVDLLKAHRQDLGPKALAAFDEAVADENTSDIVFSNYLRQASENLIGRGIALKVRVPA